MLTRSAPGTGTCYGRIKDPLSEGDHDASQCELTLGQEMHVPIARLTAVIRSLFARPDQMQPVTILADRIYIPQLEQQAIPQLLQLQPTTS
jgi:hypothetical protein